MKNYCCSVLALLLGMYATAIAQLPNHRLVSNVPFLAAGDTLPSALAGGMSAPQFSAIDLNGDGFKDLVVFDRMGDVFSTYRNCGQKKSDNNYRYDPSLMYALNGVEANGWALFVDYTCDGFEDIFVGNNSFINVYKQIRYGANKDSVRFIRTVKDLSEGKKQFNIYSSITDLPAITDIDGDGDIDMASFGSSSNFIYYYRNMAKDSLNRCDTIVYKMETPCWGHFYESGSDNSAFLGMIDPNYGCGLPAGFIPPKKIATPSGNSGSSTRHAGSTLLFVNINGDSTIDALIGDVSFNDLYALRNRGTRQHAYIDSCQKNYPQQDTAVDIEIFPAAFYVDVDNDSIKDLLAAPNDMATENHNATRLYKNVGANDSLQPKFVEKGYLQKDMLDVGAVAMPTFFNYNHDSLPDLLVGNFGYYSRKSQSVVTKLALFVNVGTRNAPAFSLVDSNYLNIPSTLIKQLRVAPAAGDIDADGDDDLLLGLQNGRIRFYRNTAAANQPAIFTLETDSMADIQIMTQGLGAPPAKGKSAYPTLYDVDGDSDLDLFVGGFFGNISFYRNNGTPQVPDFQPSTFSYGKILIGDGYGGAAGGNAAPLFADYDGDGNAELFVGCSDGRVFIYPRPTNPTDSVEVIAILFDYDFGRMAMPTAARLDTSANLTFLVGNQRGGMQMWRVPTAGDSAHKHCTCAKPTVSISNDRPLRAAEELFQLIPNPTADAVRLLAPRLGEATVTLYTATGTLLRTYAWQPETALSLSLGDLPNGVYFVRVQTPTQSGTQKILLQR